ncbi:RBPJ-interacting and tubulin-associated protein 1-like [Acipenser oxyrinchus oxyrinchus]|uniref:RBPJ-interacting and tubulin-associated protein 1 n=1 Tax=Acipenser oxyrinchus oxyrinchus TaxID=40147 RepID=A0AAD8G0N7_ACIOX|nr:RBPJ-interacting and tubulin-associated protein 1-like [Acipenser oxyrinchus oxyrinchus]
MSVELAVTGVQAFRAPSRAGGGCRGDVPGGLLFSGARRDGASQSQLWHPTRPEVPTTPLSKSSQLSRATLRKKNKYRLKSHTPTYCDESLFGSPEEAPAWKSPWTKKDDIHKSRPLLWTPPTLHTCTTQAPPTNPAKAPPLKEAALETQHGSTEFLYESKRNFWNPPESEEDEGMGSNLSWVGEKGATRNSREVELRQRPASAFTDLAGRQANGRVQSASLSKPAWRPKTTGSIKTKPPWRY